MKPLLKLNDYFDVVDDFFHKTFRDDCHMFLAIKSLQATESYTSSRFFFSKRDERAELQEASSILAERVGGASRGPEGAQSAESAAPQTLTSMANAVFFSPRLLLLRDGSAYGKVKLGCDLQVPYVCRFGQNLVMTSDGVVSTNVIIRELIQGLALKGRIAVNTIAPPSEDVSSMSVEYERSDFYSTFGYQRNGLGSSNVLVDFGTKFFNLIAGAGAERQTLSFLEQQEDRLDQLNALYAGLGFSGSNWSVAGKLIRSSDAWSAARIAMYQKMARSTSVACSYNFDLTESRALVTIGLSQGFLFQLPTVFGLHQLVQSECQPASMPPASPSVPPAAGATSSHRDPAGATGGSGLGSTGQKHTVREPLAPQPTPLVFAMKASTDGHVVATVRGTFNRVVHWGIVVQKNILAESHSARFGVTLSMESE